VSADKVSKDEVSAVLSSAVTSPAWNTTSREGIGMLVGCGSQVGVVVGIVVVGRKGINFLLSFADLKLPTELVQRLIEMGFPRQQCEKAVESTKSTNIDECVAWILSNKPVSFGESLKTLMGGGGGFVKTGGR
jgi:hypothetical protein